MTGMFRCTSKECGNKFKPFISIKTKKGTMWICTNCGTKK